MKKRLLLLASLITILFIAACSSGDSDEANGTSNGNEADGITVWAWDPKFNIKALEIAEEAYKAENPDFQLNVIENAQDDIVQKLNTSLSSGTTKGLPNIVLIEDYRVKSFLEAYPDSFHEITGSIEVSDFTPYKIAATSIDDKNYGVPFDTGATGLYVRTDYLEEAGYTTEDLQDIDWNEYIEIGKKVKEVTGKKLLTNDHNDFGIIRVLIQSGGSWYTEEDGVTINITDNEPLKAAFKVYKELVDADLMAVHSDWNQLLEAINSGSVASIPTGNWFTPSIKAEESQSGNWAVVPIPSLPEVEGATHASNLGGSSWYVLNIDGKEEAVDFLTSTFGSNAAFYQDLVTEMGAVGTYIPAMEEGAYEISDDYFGGQEIYNDFTKWSEEIPEVNYGLHTYAIDDILIVAMQDYLNGGDLDKVLESAQKQAETQIK
ncbi:ABC transporter substrate-binding protein [Oceanobacillus arenosus]|uniref:ABC transporter substrate-binding protein n=1 Tax=Oceanobacillus arenosus TaxID=1229153 RepID=A0A3D8Q305_9BACI|nr:ABC transporter substrate-binding protein [Oceanobacillus arenosus]RDW22141.1 ABC transporter substrate-binding protein [Oceanobacillus arenosus]